MQNYTNCDGKLYIIIFEKRKTIKKKNYERRIFGKI